MLGLRELGDTIIENCFTAYECTDDEMAFAQVLCVAEEAGEFVGAFRRYRDLARRAGTREEMEAELADVVIAAFAAASILDIDLEVAIINKRERILTRGWKADPVRPPSEPQPVADLEDATAAQVREGHEKGNPSPDWDPEAPGRSMPDPLTVPLGHVSIGSPDVKVEKL